MRHSFLTGVWNEEKSWTEVMWLYKMKDKTILNDDQNKWLSVLSELLVEYLISSCNNLGPSVV